MHGTDHTIHRADAHVGWDNAIAPVVTVAPGETVAFEVTDASGGQLGPESTPADIGRLDQDKVNPTTGPIAIDGAEPGDALIVDIEWLGPSGWGWTANIPGFGLLADDFPEPALHLWRYDRVMKQPAAFGPGGRVPLKPFPGTIGVAPGAPGRHSVIPPRRVGGNLDARDIAEGARLVLPVECARALFSVGDTHAAQGDGEVCGTAIESPMDIALRFDLAKGAAPPFPRYTTPGPVAPHLDQKGYEVTTGIGPDLMQAVRDAVRGMVDRLAARHGLAPVDAYMLCSVCADLRIAQVVDRPNWTVGFYFPRVVLD